MSEELGMALALLLLKLWALKVYVELGLIRAGVVEA